MAARGNNARKKTKRRRHAKARKAALVQADAMAQTTPARVARQR